MFRQVIELMTSPTTPKDDDPPQSQFSRSVCLMKGLTFFLFLLCPICFHFSSNETGETRMICIAMLLNIMILSMFALLTVLKKYFHRL